MPGDGRIVRDGDVGRAVVEDAPDAHDDYADLASSQAATVIVKMLTTRAMRPSLNPPSAMSPFRLSSARAVNPEGTAMMNRLKAAVLAAALWMLPVAALAQSSPNWPFNYVPTTAEWNLWFSNKTDFTGAVPITAGGGTFTGKVNFAPSGSSTAGMNCGVGTAPSSPINGDIWCTSTQMFVRLNGISVAIGGSVNYTANLPLIGNGTGPIAQGTVTSTNGSTLFATASGSTSTGCAQWLNGNLTDTGVACTTVSSGSVSAGTANQLGYYAGTGSAISGLGTCNNGFYGTNGSGVPSCSTLIPSSLGGTGVNNGSSTITLAGSLVTSGANSLTLTTIGATNVTFPTSGNLMNQNGTSGGIPYYNSATTVQSSAALTANLPLFGGGAAASPFSGTRTGSTTEVATYTGSAPTSTHCAQWDASGNLTDSGATCAGASGGAVLLATLTASASASLTDVGNCSTGGSTGCFTATYLNYLVVLTNIVAGSPATGVGCQIAIWNGSYQVSGYITSGTQTANGGTLFVPATPTTYIPCSQVGASSGANSGGAPGVSGQFTFYNPSAAAKPQVDGRYTLTGGSTGSPTVYWGLTSGMYNSSGAITGFRVCYGTVGGTCAGTIASGSIKVYGLP